MPLPAEEGVVGVVRGEVGAEVACCCEPEAGEAGPGVEAAEANAGTVPAMQGGVCILMR